MSGGGVGAIVNSCGGMLRAADVAHERPAGRLVQVADVVGGVAGRVLDPERALDVALAAASARAGSPPAPGTISPHSARRPSSPPYSRPALATSRDGSTMCGAPRSCT